MHYRSNTNRYLCDVLEEMRTCFKTLNFASMLSLIEEAQTLANRMEANLHDKKDITVLKNERTSLKREVKVLEAKKVDLESYIETERSIHELNIKRLKREAEALK